MPKPKKTAASQSSTLLDFFASPTKASAKPTVKATSKGKNSTTPKAAAAKGKGGAPKAVAAAATDVIVISDDDEPRTSRKVNGSGHANAAQRPAVKREHSSSAPLRLAGKRVGEDAMLAQPGPSRPTKRVRASRSPSVTFVDDVPHLVRRDNDDDAEGWGEPTLLLEPALVSVSRTGCTGSSLTITHPFVDHTAAPSASSFGVPTQLPDPASATPGSPPILAAPSSPFGEPLLLLRSAEVREPTPDAAPDTLPVLSVVAAADPVTGDCTPPPNRDNDDVVLVAPSLTTTFASGSGAPSVPDVQPEEDFWETGDDEQGLERDGDAGDTSADAASQLGESQFGDEPNADADVDMSALDPRTCPVCAAALGEDAEDAESHVLACMQTLELDADDATETASRPEPKCLGRMPPPTPLGKGKGKARDPAPASGNAFSLLMANPRAAEQAAWSEAAAAEDRGFRPTKANGGRRKAPFYKVLQGMPIAVDAFRYGAIPGVNAYFLTHAHSDHYTNLSGNWKTAPIYCSEGTANLIVHMLGVGREWVHAIPEDVPTEIPNTGGVKVTVIEANHCPGSSLFLFEGQQTVHAGDSTYKSPHVGSGRTFRYLHCGDFRASPQHVLHPAVKGKKLDVIYLDTTYLDPKYCFPPQPLVIDACAELAKRLIEGRALRGDSPRHETVAGFFTPAIKQEDGSKKGKNTNTLVVVGTYSIGKERIVKAIARALNTTVYCDARKAAILRCQNDPDLHALLSTDPLRSRVHLVPLGTVSSDRLKDYVARYKSHYTHALAFRPTGWTFSPPAGSDTLPAVAAVIKKSQARGYTHADLRPMRNSTPALALYGVPYSEHSSFFELCCFALSLDWGRIIATVNVGSENSRRKMGRWIEKWEQERKKGDKKVVPHRAPDYW